MKESPLKRLLVAAHYRARGLMTELTPASAKMTPDFILIGAQKAGTTSMFDYLVSHPQVLEPWFKEMDFFNRRRMFEGRSSYTLDDYRALFPLKWTARRLELRTGKSIVTGEASQYMSFEEAPGRIRLLLPGIKFIVLLRNPVFRAYSHYCMRQRYGWENDSFLDAFFREDITAGMNGGSSYKFRGLYATHLEWWFKAFPKEQFLIFASDDVRTDRLNAYDRLCNFLGIENFHLQSNKESNVGKYELPSADVLEIWQEFFRPHNEKLFKLIGRDYGWNK